MAYANFLLPVALDERRFPRTWEALRAGLADQVAPGFVAGLWRKTSPQQIFLAACGQRRIASSSLASLPMTTDTIFDLSSVSKIFATSALTAVLVERGWLSWDSPVSAFFEGYSHTQIRLHHLLSHTAGFVYWEPYWEKLRQLFAPIALEKIPIRIRQKAMRELVLSACPDVAPGVRSLYSDLSFLLLGFVLEEVTQMPLDQAVLRFVWQPMKIRGPYFRRVQQSSFDARDERVAATEDCPWRQAILQGQVHDDNCWAMGGYGGHAGAFGTAQNLLQFSKMLMEGFLSQQVLHALWTRVSEPQGCARTLGWDTPSGESPSAGKYFSSNSVGHLGFTGTSLWIDPDAGLAVTLLSNRVHPSRENWKIKKFRPYFHEAIRIDLGSG